MDAALIVGLGNPGSVYAETRHNVGFMVVDELCRRSEARFVPGQGDYYRAGMVLEGTPVYVVKPTTFMNGSGPAVLDAISFFGVSIDNTLIVLDDFQLLLGTLRMRPGGSDGGHNGLASVIRALQRETFPRLRLGIGTDGMPAGPARRDFVLEAFRRDEILAVRRMVQSAADGVAMFATAGIGQAMKICNTQ